MPADAPEHVDVLIVGAGLSGVGAAHHLQDDCPGTSYVILEARGASGGTWDLFRYPGVRSDSDMYTLGYSFRPWTEAKAIADGPSILRYIRDTARDAGIDERIRYHQRVVRAEWSTAEGRWTVDAEHPETGEVTRWTCGFLFGNAGYYRYDHGYTPEFTGRDRFTGPVIHPQLWPEDLDWSGKRVVVIGSGATAVTLVPALAAKAAHVTMLQRSPAYVLSLPEKDTLADRLRGVLPARVAYPLIRWKNVLMATVLFQLSRRAPKFMRAALQKGVARQVPADFDVGTHFTPRYGPWDQRLCFVPDGDLFRAISDGSASVVTGRIATFTEDGVELESGETVDADIIVTATGLDVQFMGGMTLTVDGSEVALTGLVAYKGAMFCGVPNLASTFGYTNASWTLKADLVARFVCRILNHMDERGYSKCTPRKPSPRMATEPFIDLASGYIERAAAILPRQGSTTPWKLHQNYPLDVVMLRFGRLDDQMDFSGTATADIPGGGDGSGRAPVPL